MEFFLIVLVAILGSFSAVGYEAALCDRLLISRRLQNEFGLQYEGVGAASGWWVYVGRIGELKLGFRDSGAVRWIDVPPGALLDVGVTREELARIVPGDIYQLSPLAAKLTRISREALLEKVSGNQGNDG